MHFKLSGSKSRNTKSTHKTRSHKQNGGLTTSIAHQTKTVSVVVVQQVNATATIEYGSVPSMFVVAGLACVGSA